MRIVEASIRASHEARWCETTPSSGPGSFAGATRWRGRSSACPLEKAAVAATSAATARPAPRSRLRPTVAHYTGDAEKAPPFRLLDGDGLRQVSRLVDVEAAELRDPVREQLERHHGEHGLQEGRRPRDRKSTTSELQSRGHLVCRLLL